MLGKQKCLLMTVINLGYVTVSHPLCWCPVVLSEAVRMSLNEEGYVVRIRGLPWSCTQEEVASFFSGMNAHVFNRRRQKESSM